MFMIHIPQSGYHWFIRLWPCISDLHTTHLELGQYLAISMNLDDNIVLIRICVVGQPWYSCSELGCRSTGQVINPAPGACFILKLISLAQLSLAQ